MHRRHLVCHALLLPLAAALGPDRANAAAQAPAPPGPAADASRRRLPLVLARRAPEDIDPSGYLVSEKLDGVRAFWDGERLWFRSGLPIAVPDMLGARLPRGVALDGELWAGRGRFEALVGAVRRAEPRASEWRSVRYLAFELPEAPGPFAERARRLQQLLGDDALAPVSALRQVALPDREALRRHLDEVVAGGGEGLMLHRADAPFVAGRTAALLKLKPEDDAEAQVVAHLPGRGRLQGRVGALRVRTADGVEFVVGSGLSDAVREHPPAVGRWITFTHRGLTERGVPRFASYLRERTL